MRALVPVALLVLALAGCTSGPPAPSTLFDAASADAGPAPPSEARIEVPALGALLEEVRVAVCGEPDVFLEGTRGGVCSALDDVCARGVLDPELDCCRAEPRAPGVACGEGAACDGDGECVAVEDAALPRAEVVEGVLGSEHWIDLAGGGVATLGYAEGAVAIGAGESTVVEIATAADAVLDLSTVRVVPLARFGVGGVLGHPARAIELATDAAQVCVTPAGEAALSVRTDCSGGTRVACPGASGGISCEVLAGHGVRLRGDALGLAFPLPAEGADGDAELHALGFALPGIGSGTACRLGEVQACVNACGRLSSRSCTIFGSWGACSTPTEVCDGADNDCDGRVDEPTSGMCDDGLACSLDVCRELRYPTSTGAIRTLYACTNPVAPSCGDTADCTRHVCSRTAPTVGVGQRVVRAGSDPACWAIRDDTWCAGTWDSCDSNGQETCDPQRALDIASGCAPASLDSLPCELDGNLCTTEIGCEANPGCRLGHLEGRRLTACEALSVRRPVGDRSSRTIACHRIDGRNPVADFFEDRRDPEACNEGNSCTDDLCNPDTGACEHTDRPVGSPCADGETSANLCYERTCRRGLSEMYCWEQLSSDGEMDCPAVPDLVGPPLNHICTGPSVLERRAGQRFGAPVTYEVTSRCARGGVVQSCHTYDCTAEECRIAPRGSCGPRVGCLVPTCTTRTDVMHDGLVGCEVARDDFFCRQDLPADNQCLVATCQADGSCDVRRDNTACRIDPTVICRPDEGRAVTCEPNGRCGTRCVPPPI